MFSWCANSEGAKKGHLCVFSCVSAARHCVWTSSHRTSSCRQKVAPLNASAGVLAGAMSFHILSHSPRCGRCAASSSPCWILWETQEWTISILFISHAVVRGCIYAHTVIKVWSEKHQPTHLPPDSLQLGQVHATLRSLLPSWPNWSSSSTSLTWRWDRSLVFRVESLLNCQSPASGSSFIRMSEQRGQRNVHVNINISTGNSQQKTHSENCFITVCDWQLTAFLAVSLYTEQQHKRLGTFTNWIWKYKTNCNGYREGDGNRGQCDSFLFAAPTYSAGAECESTKLLKKTLVQPPLLMSSVIDSLTDSAVSSHANLLKFLIRAQLYWQHGSEFHK